MDDAFEHAVRLVEAFIFASAEPVALSALARLVPMPYSAHEVLEVLGERCEGRGVELAEVGGGGQFGLGSLRDVPGGGTLTLAPV
jgi:segregation and condensation protein B